MSRVNITHFMDTANQDLNWNNKKAVFRLVTVTGPPVLYIHDIMRCGILYNTTEVIK